MFSTDLLFAIKRDAYIFKETGCFCKFPKHQKLEIKSSSNLGGKKKRNKRRIHGLLVNARDVCHWTKQFKSRWKKMKTGKKQRLRFRWSYVCKLVFVCQDVILWSLSMKNINYNYFLSINAGAIEWTTRKISTCYSADSVSRPHHISFQRVIFVFLIFGY